MIKALSDEALDHLFREARAHDEFGAAS